MFEVPGEVLLGLLSALFEPEDMTDRFQIV
jgi:hypothetical protein